MKKILLYIVASILCFSSCKKDKKPTSQLTDSKTYSVKFNVSGFTQEITPGSGQKINAVGTNAITVPGVKKLFYYVFNSTGKLIHSIVQDSAATNFGNIEDYLADGTYDIVFIANGVTLDIAGSELFSKRFAILHTDRETESVIDTWGETFYKRVTLTVASGDIKQNVTLKRIVSKLTLKLLDALPQNAAKFVITVDKDNDAFMFKDASMLGFETSRIFTKPIPPSAAGSSNYSTSIILLAATTDMKVDVKCYDTANKLIAHVVVPGVSVQPNTQTILSGYLFSPNNDFNIGLNKSWDSSIDIQF
ncbi:MAG: FimB/Mfa2 family fimbrial subunit [Bacteroidota bacterium]